MDVNENSNRIPKLHRIPYESLQYSGYNYYWQEHGVNFISSGALYEFRGKNLTEYLHNLFQDIKCIFSFTER
jgi:hypothetical protein